MQHKDSAMNMLQNTVTKWEQYYEEELKDTFLFPNEYVVRTFLGNYPLLKMDKNYSGKTVCDISCGDGRNMVLLNKLKLKIYGTEVSDKICQITQNKLLHHADNIQAEIKKGLNWDLPFEEAFFDYALSWNSLYYMADENASINEHINEHARILKPNGYLICSVPSPDCFSLKNAIPLGNHLIQLNPEYNWGKRNIHKDTIYYQFESFAHIENILGSHFYNFQTCRLSDNCYGLQLDYFVFVCQKIPPSALRAPSPGGGRRS